MSSDLSAAFGAATVTPAGPGRWKHRMDLAGMAREAAQRLSVSTIFRDATSAAEGFVAEGFAAAVRQLGSARRRPSRGMRRHLRRVKAAARG